MAGLPTIGDLRRVGIIASQEVVAAIDLFMRDPAAGPFRFASGHSLDIAALVTLSLGPERIRDRAGPHEKTFRTAVAALVMAAHPYQP
ncbi:hypothetical protein [Methylobacterium sp. SI9]|uniref:hypothetical protein n=1 Tax=Methylobacterium guangdongense TaxID=3138811 RepID=UPI00313D6FBA